MDLPFVQDALFEHLAAIGHAMSSPHRLRLLGLLAQGEKTVERIAEQSGQSVASASAHLKVLRSANLVEAQRDGRFVRYRLAGDSVLRFWIALRQLGREQSPEVRELARTYFEDPQSLVQFSEKELIDQVRDGHIILLDVRPADEFQAGHLPGAQSMPLDELDRRLKCLPKRKPIVAYCRGPYCVAAIEACELLRRRGFRVQRLSLGAAEWRAAGRELETGVT